MSDDEQDYEFASASEGEEEKSPNQKNPNQKIYTKESQDKPVDVKTEKTSEVPPISPDIAPTISSWLNWGSSIVKNLGENIMEGVDKVYDTLEGETIKKEEGTKEVTELLDNMNVAEENNNPAEFIFSGIDRTFDLASQTIGNAFFTGIKKIEEADLKGKASQVFEHLKNDSRFNQGKEVGEEMLNKGLGYLELIGQSTVNAINEKVRPGILPSKKVDNATPTFESYMEDFCGTAHQSALQMLATESSLKLKGFLKDLTDEKLNGIDIELLAIDRKFESLIEESEDLTESKLDETEFLKLLNVIGLESCTQVRSLYQMLQSIPEDFKEQDKVTLPFMTIAKYTSKAIEVFLRISEALLLATAERKAPDDESAVIDNLKQVSLTLLSELNFICNSLIANKNEEESVIQTTESAATIIQEAAGCIVDALPFTFMNKLQENMKKYPVAWIAAAGIASYMIYKYKRIPRLGDVRQEYKGAAEKLNKATKGELEKDVHIAQGEYQKMKDIGKGEAAKIGGAVKGEASKIGGALKGEYEELKGKFGGKHEDEQRERGKS